MNMNVKKLKAEFIQFIPPVIETLKKLGGSGRAAEVRDSIIDEMNVSEQTQQELCKNGTPKVINQVDWARFYLMKTGYLYSSSHGVWSLTDQGRKATLSRTDAEGIVQQVRRDVRASRKDESDIKDIVEDAEHIDSSPEAVADHREDLLSILKSLSPNGFERICQLLLRESGFQKVVVTGRTGDGGIDGHGLLQINPLISMQVVFQCKKYDKSVTVSHIRDFRGAMAGRADKGIFLTTGSFTGDAKDEARREGVPPIELVDGPKLLDMFESLGLGLHEKVIYEIDEEYFKQFME